MSSTRWRLVVGMVLSVVVLVPAGLSSACVGVASLVSHRQTVQPGGTLTVTGRSFAQKVPIQIRLDSPTGPVLVTVPGPDTTMTSRFTVDVPIPADISNGQHLLLASQDHHDMNVGAPARAVFYVNMAPPASPPPAKRPAAVVVSSGPSVLVLVLIGLGVAAAGLLIAGLLGRVGSRGGPRPETSR